MKTYMIDLCCDMGESFGNFKIGNDDSIMQYISSANVACGFHAGDPVVMDHTIKLAKKFNVAIGAHPGYLDLMGFGRRKMELTYNEVKCYVKYQIGALKTFVESEGLKLQHVFLHGALNSAAAKIEDTAIGVIEGIKEIDEKLIFLHRPHLLSYEVAKKRGLDVATVIGIDTDYTIEGLAIPQRKKKKISPADTALKAVQLVKEKKIKTVEGKYLSIDVDSILIHGDTPNSVSVLKKIHQYFEKEDIQVRDLKNVIGNKSKKTEK